MAASGRLQPKTILIIALALFSCVANGELSHRIGVSNRRNLAAKTPAADNPEATPEAADAPSSDKDKTPAVDAPSSDKDKTPAADAPSAAKAKAPSADSPAASADNATAPAADPKAADAPAADPKAADAPAADGPSANDTAAAADAPTAGAPAGNATTTGNGTAPSATSIDDSGATVFDVTKHGAKADGKFDNAQAFIQTWKAACESASPAKVLIPAGTFMTSPAIFQGPCKSTKPVIVEVIGTVEASQDLSDYPSKEWLMFEHIDGLVIKGKGTFDGKGESAWQFNDCKKSNYKNCQGLPSNIKFGFVTNGVITGITSLNSKYFHFHITDSGQITVDSINIIAPDESPNTDGIHISNTKTISVINSKIGTGDDCVSVGQGVVGLRVTGVTCGPGHGISIGSLGKYKDEEDVSDIIVSNCTLRNTTNGARIKSYGGSPPSLATKIIFQDLIMDQVKNPIIIDQKYGSRAGAPSQVKISDVHFKNIKGTTISDVAVNFLCSSQVPCEGVELANIDLKYVGVRNAPNGLVSECENAKVSSVGTTPSTLACAK